MGKRSMKNIMSRFLPEKQKRMKIAIGAMVVNYILFLYGMYKGTDLTSLGTGLTMVNIPLMTWILGESIRPTMKIENELGNEIK